MLFQNQWVVAPEEQKRTNCGSPRNSMWLLPQICPCGLFDHYLGEKQLPISHPLSMDYRARTFSPGWQPRCQIRSPRDHTTLGDAIIVRSISWPAAKLVLTNFCNSSVR